jgi:2-isopropylmalate synthase
MKETTVKLYDTTLRDGSQGEGINFSLHDKLRLAEKLDEFGMHYIEGGWPGSNEKDIAFFKEAEKRKYKNAKIAAFGSTRRADTSVEDDSQVRLLVEAGTPVVTLVAKSWLLHVHEVLRTTPEENLRMISETVAYLKNKGREVMLDFEHFFDGYKDNPEFSRHCLSSAQEAGADWLILCDTNGGSLPDEVGNITKQVVTLFKTPVGIHTHNDSGLAVANALAAINAGATQVQGTVNGYGERTGNCNLTTVIPNLQLKMGRQVLTPEKLAQLKSLSHFVDEIANQPHDRRAPFVGDSSFAHKGGIHVNAVNKLAKSYEHIDPTVVGNRQRVLVGELSGRGNVAYKARELGIDLAEKSPEAQRILEEVKKREAAGYEYEAADASFELLIRQSKGEKIHFFTLSEYHVSIRRVAAFGYKVAEATLKLDVNGHENYTVAEGDGPVHALDRALRKALGVHYPAIKQVKLIDYKVRILDSHFGTEAKIRVFITSSDGQREWTTTGVSGDIIQASWLALEDAFNYYLLKNSRKA